MRIIFPLTFETKWYSGFQWLNKKMLYWKSVFVEILVKLTHGSRIYWHWTLILARCWPVKERSFRLWILYVMINEVPEEQWGPLLSGEWSYMCINKHNGKAPLMLGDHAVYVPIWFGPFDLTRFSTAVHFNWPLMSGTWGDFIPEVMRQ